MIDRKLYYQEHKEAIKKHNKKWTDKNIERVKEYNKKWVSDNRDRVRAASKRFYINHKTELLPYLRQYHKERRHRLGLNKKYNSIIRLPQTIENKRNYMRLWREKHPLYDKQWREKNKIKVKVSKLKRHTLDKDLKLETVQRVYEDNIIKYNTLTCYLCNIPINFGQDSIDHKHPLSRGGSNDYENLGIAHRICNCIKGVKTEEEYREYILRK